MICLQWRVKFGMWQQQCCDAAVSIHRYRWIYIFTQMVVRSPKRTHTKVTAATASNKESWGRSDYDSFEIWDLIKVREKAFDSLLCDISPSPAHPRGLPCQPCHFLFAELVTEILWDGSQVDSLLLNKEPAINY